NAEIPAPTPDAAPLAADRTTPQNRSAIVSSTPSTKAPTAPAKAELTAPVEKNISAPAETIIRSAPQKDKGAIPTTETTVTDTGEPLASSSAAPQTAAILQSEPASDAWKYLAAAAALLLLALDRKSTRLNFSHQIISYA